MITFDSFLTCTEMDFDSTNLSLENHRLKDQLASYVVLQEQNAKLKQTLEVILRLHDHASTSMQAVRR